MAFSVWDLEFQLVANSWIRLINVESSDRNILFCVFACIKVEKCTIIRFNETGLRIGCIRNKIEYDLPFGAGRDPASSQ
jgi:hypothetical protein